MAHTLEGLAHLISDHFGGEAGRSLVLRIPAKGADTVVKELRSKFPEIIIGFSPHEDEPVGKLYMNLPSAQEGTESSPSYAD